MSIDIFIYFEIFIRTIYLLFKIKVRYIFFISHTLIEMIYIPILKEVELV